MSVPSYQSYNPSGIEWLGEVPAHWTSTRVKWICSFATGWTPPTGDANFYEGDNLWANISDRFNVIASPNDWTRKTRTGVRHIDEEAQAESHRIRLTYWASFAEYLKEKGSTFRIRRANRDHWFSFGIGGRGFHLNATISTDKQRVGVELYAPNDIDKTAFRALYAQKDAIEKEIGEPLEWMELPGKKATRIVIYKSGVDPSDEKQYPELHAWMLAKMDRFKSVFAPRIKSLVLPSSTTTPEESEEVSEKAALG